MIRVDVASTGETEGSCGFLAMAFERPSVGLWARDVLTGARSESRATDFQLAREREPHVAGAATATRNAPLRGEYFELAEE